MVAEVEVEMLMEDGGAGEGAVVFDEEVGVFFEGEGVGWWWWWCCGGWHVDEGCD